MTDLPTVELTLDQLVELRQSAPEIPEQLAALLRPGAVCVTPLDYLAHNGADGLQASWSVATSGERVELELRAYGGQIFARFVFPIATDGPPVRL